MLISRVGDVGIDLPDANVAIEVASLTEDRHRTPTSVDPLGTHGTPLGTTIHTFLAVRNVKMSDSAMFP